jgi:dephospho-CoA kinase
MNIIGLTGGVGMGKSTAANLLKERGLPVIDTDLLAREVVEPGKPAWEEIRRVFGPGILGPDGKLRRDELARQVFTDEARRKQLEAIVHPRIRERWLAQVELWRAEKRPRCVVVIPLLFETNGTTSFNTIICVACSPGTQRERLLARGWSLEQIQQRIQAQWPVEKKIALAHFVVWTEGGLVVHAQQLNRILQGLPSQ